MPDHQREDHQAGRLLDGRYRIGARIARGGMASVYEAVDTRLDRTVAVKIMHPGLGDGSNPEHGDSFARRFVREAKAAARLSHPNVVAVYDQGQDDSDGTTYLVMELVTGHTLRDTIAKEAPMSPERALALLDPVLSALATAHRAGLIHRDIKPENVLIADDGRIKVADFGLARAITSDTQHTATTGVLIGTVSYLAPELVVEQRADARADVYAVGVILFELLTGAKPHTGESPIAVAYRHVHHDVPAPSTLAPSTPAYVDALVARATTRDPSLRPADATVLLHHVRRVVHALHDGVREDPELVADLLPSARVAESDSDHDINHDTTPEPVRSLAAAVPRTSDNESTAVLGGPAPLRAPRSPAAAPPSPAGPADPGRSRRGRRRIVLGVVIALLVAALGTTGYWFGWGRYTTTPSVLGLSQAAAVDKLEQADLEAEVTEEVHSETVEKGEVVATDPQPGDRVLPGDTVGLTVSLGPERYDVPDLVGLTVAQAEAELAGVKMVLGTQRQVFNDAAKGTIVKMTPAFGSDGAAAQKPGKAIAVWVSKGLRPIKVQDWSGRDADDIKARLEKRGLIVRITDSQFSDDVPEGAIISQKPASGTVFKGDTVEFVVSKGPELVTIPGIRYDSTEDAIEKLEALGLVVDTEHATIYLSGTVAWSTDPESGTRVRKGSTVILYVV
ncbi:Stk1 family PASTA domain-containing Ser/Thr kinase [Nocardioides caeni]|uniref:Stk1 family PASTA domain-containing Ser/Thr kinase n=1 Tax=Nocardioides caeni TaxID=574700 RepID=UPI001EE79BAB|nr:Stk1 family PASTA domain-containing Ser/Thr kinase [Nocardioides caeni]